MIQALIWEKGWLKLERVARVKSIYQFVRDSIAFGYNQRDDLPASTILMDGYGQCNTKSTLLMALLRAAEIPNRIHGFTIDKALQKGAITGLWYWLAPKNILHSWVEVFVENEWYYLEGVILDNAYLSALQKANSNYKTTFCGFGVYTDSFQNPQIEWNLNHTFIQQKGINQDFGLFDSPDNFYEKHHQKIGVLKQFIFQNFARKTMNRNISRVRSKPEHDK